MFKLIYKYSLKKSIQIVFLVLISIGILLTIGRWYSAFNNEFVLFTDEINLHISNLSLSMIVYLGIGYSWILSGVKFRNVIFLGVFLIIANFICETLMGFMNTPDIIDAIYGTIGIVIAFVFLYIANRYGLMPNNENGV